jgi:hypothetical protein
LRQWDLVSLEFLWYTLREVAGANNISQDEAVQKFLKDIGDQYDDKVGLESKVQKLRVEVNILKQQLFNV